MSLAGFNVFCIKGRQFIGVWNVLSVVCNMVQYTQNIVQYNALCPAIILEHSAV